MNKTDISLKELRPDYLFWIQKQNWTLYEAGYLLLDLEPRLFLDDDFKSDVQLPPCPIWLEEKSKEYGVLLQEGPFKLLNSVAPSQHASFYKKQEFSELEAVYTVPCQTIFKWAQKIQLEIPRGFLEVKMKETPGIHQDSTIPKKKDEKPLKGSQEDRIACRTIAKMLWDENPNMTIEEMKKHPSIRKYGSLSQYKGRDTLRTWIKDLDPRPLKQKTGRPPKPTVAN